MTAAMVWLGAVLAVGTIADANGAADASLERLVQAFGTEACAARWHALEKFLAFGRDAHRAVKQGIRATPDSRIRARLMMLRESFLEQERSLARLEAFTSQLQKASSIGDEGRRSAEVDRIRRQLLKIIGSSREPFAARLQAATFMAVMVTEFAPGVTAPWVTDVQSFLTSPDPQVRLMGSLLAKRGRFPKGQEPEMGVVVPTLIEGLKGQSFAERQRSQRDLFLLTNVSPEAICVDPTDSDDIRAAGVRQWEEWWINSRGKLATERIQQLY